MFQNYFYLKFYEVLSKLSIYQIFYIFDPIFLFPTINNTYLQRALRVKTKTTFLVFSIFHLKPIQHIRTHFWSLPTTYARHTASYLLFSTHYLLLTLATRRATYYSLLTTY